jgi:putative transposase
VWLDALAVRTREEGRIVRVAVVVATAVSGDGLREILSLDVFTSEDEAAWSACLAGLVGRGLSGVRLVIPDDHRGLTRAIDSLLPGVSWQCCRTRVMRNLLCRVPKSTQPFVATLVRTIFAQPSAEEVAAQLERVHEQLARRFPVAAELLERAAPDIAAFAQFPVAHWGQIWSNNPQERLNRETRRRSDAVGIFPGREAVVRLVGMVLAEQHDEWAVARRYMSGESLAAVTLPRTELEASDDDAADDEEVVPVLVAAAG